MGTCAISIILGTFFIFFLLILEIFKHSEKWKKLYSEHLYAQHLDPTVINLLSICFIIHQSISLCLYQPILFPIILCNGIILPNKVAFSEEACQKSASCILERLFSHLSYHSSSQNHTGLPCIQCAMIFVSISVTLNTRVGDQNQDSTVLLRKPLHTLLTMKGKV